VLSSCFDSRTVYFCVFQKKTLYGYKRHFRTSDVITSVTDQQAKLMAFPEFSEASIKTRVFILLSNISLSV